MKFLTRRDIVSLLACLLNHLAYCDTDVASFFGLEWLWDVSGQAEASAPTSTCAVSFFLQGHVPRLPLDHNCN